MERVTIDLEPSLTMGAKTNEMWTIRTMNHTRPRDRGRSKSKFGGDNGSSTWLAVYFSVSVQCGQ